jgi:hypothetical protein
MLVGYILAGSRLRGKLVRQDSRVIPKACGQTSHHAQKE